MRLAGELKHSFVNGPGIRYVVFFQGCPHHCPGCHNPETHADDGGTVCTVEQVVQRICSTPFLDGVTLSGGDPFAQPEACRQLARAIREQGLSVWAYSGWTLEQLLAEEDRAAVLPYVDVLVDGPFLSALKSDSCLWRGSTNQRLIDVPASLAAGKAVEFIDGKDRRC